MDEPETQTCEYRRHLGEIVLDCYREMFVPESAGSGQTALAKLIGDLLHACDLQRLSFAEALRHAAVEKRCEVLAELEEAFERSPVAAPKLTGINRHS
jgi:hypothetical protein